MVSAACFRGRARTWRLGSLVVGVGRGRRARQASVMKTPKKGFYFSRQKPTQAMHTGNSRSPCRIFTSFVASRGSAEPGRSDAVVLVIWRATPAYLQGLCLARQYVIHRGLESFDHAPFLLRNCDVFNVVWRSCFSRRPRCCGGLSTAMATFGPGLDMQ